MCLAIDEKSGIMSAEGGRSNTRFAVYELTRQFGRPDAMNSPVSGPLLAHQKSLPKILSHIAKTPPAALDSTDNINNHSFNSMTGSNGLMKPHPPDPDDNNQTTKEEIKQEEIIVKESSSFSSFESESDSESPATTTAAAPNPVTSIAQIRPTLRQPPAVAQPSKIQSSDYVIGLDQLQEQVRRLALRRGFTLNIMVVGKSRCAVIIHLVSSKGYTSEFWPHFICKKFSLLLKRPQWVRQVDSHQHFIPLFRTSTYGVHCLGIRTCQNDWNTLNSNRFETQQQNKNTFLYVT